MKLDQRNAEAIAELRDRMAALEARLSDHDTAPESSPPPPMRRLLQAVSEEFGVPVSRLLAHSRAPREVLARHAAMAIARRCLSYSLPMIGRLMDRDHTTITHGARHIAACAAADPDLAARLNRIAAQFPHSPGGLA